MGIVSSTFASLAIQFAWNCQRLLDPQYRCLEGKRALETSPAMQSKQAVDCERQASAEIIDKRSSVPRLSDIRRKRGAIERQRYRKRPVSFDTALIINRCDNPVVNVTCVATSTPNQIQSPLREPQPQFWDVTSSSGCSSDSGSYLDSDSDVEDRLNVAFIKKYEDVEDEKEFAMSADEEAALRMTVGRGHFSRSKKDRFLNHLRLEKRLNNLNNSFCRTIQSGHGHGLRRRHSGDLYKVIY